MGGILASIRHGFANVLRFSGRDTRGQFWPFAIFVFLAATVASYLVMIPEMARMMSGMFRMAAEQQGREIAPDEMDRLIIGLMPNFERIMLISMIINIVAMLLLAAAVARRLHDRDRSGLWGLLPLPALAAGFALAPNALEFMQSDPGAMNQVMLPMLNGLATWALLIALIVLLARAGSGGPNRFGPEPGTPPQGS